MVALAESTSDQSLGPLFSVSHQKVELDIDILKRSLQGRTEITISPHSKELRAFQLNSRQCNIRRVLVNGKPCSNYTYDDPYTEATLPWDASVEQWHMLKGKIGGALKDNPEQELVVILPKNFKIEESDPLLVSKPADVSSRRDSVLASDPDTPELSRGLGGQGTRFSPFIVCVEYNILCVREGMHFVGWEEGDLRYPHAYTKHGGLPGTACCLFPCVDTINSRCTWEILIKCSKTVGDALNCRQASHKDQHVVRGHPIKVNDYDSDAASEDFNPPFSEEDRALDLAVVATGEMTDEIVDPQNPTKKTTSFLCLTPVSAWHVGFAIGPFEHVGLAEFRDSEEEERLGQTIVGLHGFCLPGRSDELRNTCFPLAKAIDFFTLTYGSYPFPNYKVCFVDDVIYDVLDTASLSICSNRLLFSENILEPLYSVTRQLVHALAAQWSGINVTRQDPADTWVVIGIAYFITDTFMRKLSGNNEYRYRQKLAADRLVELDSARPSLYDLGAFLGLDPFELEFMELKAPLVLFILDRRLTKASGSSGMSRIISKIFLNSKLDQLPNGTINTAHFVKTCEKVGHTKMDVFMTQWVYGAGCPIFFVSQKFNKKKLVVNMTIRQGQEDKPEELLNKENFMRDVKEELRGVYAGSLQPVFTGPMTIRIHEADGTPYEHIVEIKEAITNIEIPYNTKYKRLKRSRRHKERAATAAGIDFAGDGNDDVLLYCLGDVLQTEEDMREWDLAEWTKEDEEKMSQESYEWIRMDADFEWLCKMRIQMPEYMFLSQLQQDRDVVAQFESVKHFSKVSATRLWSTILVRTLMDQRYFYGIRTAAAKALSRMVQSNSTRIDDNVNLIGFDHLKKAFQALYCLPNSQMTRPNDFADQTSYYVQCAIPRAIGMVRDERSKCPFSARKFLRDKLVDNDNSSNEYSDSHYIATLLRALGEAMSSSGRPAAPLQGLLDDAMDGVTNLKGDDGLAFHNACLEEIDRYRRMDEWIPSYHNILSVTALDCKRRLVKAGATTIHLTDFLQYTRDSTSDNLRLKAFEVMVELGLIQQEIILRWFLMVLGTDPSPYVRERMLQLFGKFLAALAIGEISVATIQAAEMTAAPLAVEDDGLTMEETSTDARRKAMDRTRTIPGALDALKEEGSGNEVLKKGLWDVLSSPAMSLQEMGELLDICSLMYDANSSLIVKLRYPRYWKCHKFGKGKLRFTRSSRIRVTPIPRRQLSAATITANQINGISTAPAPMPPPVKRSFSLKPPKKETPSLPSATSSLSSDSSSSQPLVIQSQAASGTEGKKKVMLKLNLGKAAAAKSTT